MGKRNKIWKKRLTIEEIKNRYQEAQKIYYSQDKNISNIIKWTAWNTMQTAIDLYCLRNHCSIEEAKQYLEN